MENRKIIENPLRLMVDAHRQPARRNAVDDDTEDQADRHNDAQVPECQFECGGAKHMLRTQLIPESTHRVQEGLGIFERTVDRIAEVSDIYLDRVRQDDGILIPYMVDNHIFGNYFPLMMHKIFQKGKFFLGQPDVCTSPLDFICCRVER